MINFNSQTKINTTSIYSLPISLRKTTFGKHSLNVEVVSYTTIVLIVCAFLSHQNHYFPIVLSLSFKDAFNSSLISIEVAPRYFLNS